MLAGPDGRFHWEDKISEAVKVWAEKGPLRSDVAELEPDPEFARQVLLTLNAVTSVTGRVLASADRRPMAGVKVTLSCVGDGTFATDPEGRFSAPKVPPGECDVIAHATPLSAKASYPFTIVLEGDNELEVMVDLLSVVGGRVIDSSGAASAGAIVKMVGASYAQTRITQADGSFLFNDDLQQTYVLAATNGSERSATHHVAAGQKNLLVVLGPAARLEVTVIRDGALAPGVSVGIKREPSMGIEVDAQTTRADGKVTFEAISEGGWVVSGRRGNRKWHPLGALQVKNGANAFTVTLVEDGRSVRIEVVDLLDRRPVAEAEVQLGSQVVKSDLKGVALFDGVTDAENEVYVSAEGYTVAFQKLAPAAVAATIPMRGWRKLRGEVVDGRGRALADLTVAFREVLLDEGRFEVVIPSRAEPYDFRFKCRACGSKAVTVPGGDIDVDVGRVVMEGRMTLKLAVTTPDGRPAPFARIFAVNESQRWLTQANRKAPELMADARGELNLDSNVGQYCYRAWLEGFAPSSRDACPVELKEGATVKLPLILRPGGFVSGIVRRAGKPAAGILVKESEEHFERLTDERGAYQLGPLSAGEHSIIAMTYAGAEPTMDVKRVTITDGVPATLDFGSEAGSRVTVEWTGPLHPSNPIIALLRGKVPLAQAIKSGQGPGIQLKPLDASRVAVFDAVPEGEVTVLVLNFEPSMDAGHPITRIAWLNVVRSRDETLKLGPLPSGRAE